MNIKKALCISLSIAIVGSSFSVFAEESTQKFKSDAIEFLKKIKGTPTASPVCNTMSSNESEFVSCSAYYKIQDCGFTLTMQRSLNKDAPVTIRYAVAVSSVNDATKRAVINNLNSFNAAEEALKPKIEACFSEKK